MTENELYHHGILGQRWGVRRFQNKDGSLTAKGKKHLKKVYKNKIDEYDRALTAARAYRGSDPKMQTYAVLWGKEKAYFSKKLSDIDSGKVKAGEDYVLKKHMGSYKFDIPDEMYEKGMR